MSQAKQHYFLVAGNVVYSAPGEKPEDNLMGVLTLNTVVKGEEARFAASKIQQSQHALQMQFHAKMQEPALKIVDVLITNVSHLGEFTDEEFIANMITAESANDKVH